MSGESYRKLLKEASNEMKLGPFRIAIPGLAGVAMLVIAIMRLQTELAIMALLLTYIAWQQWSRYRLARRLFESLEYMSARLNQDYPEVDG